MSQTSDAPDYSSRILTPPPPATPRINGPRIYGQRPGRPFLYTIPATGDRPMVFSAGGLPDGLKLESHTGQISGIVRTAGEYHVKLHAKNAQGEDSKPLKIVIGSKIALTPPLGWNSWNCWAWAVDQDKVLRSARAIVSSGLINHGWTYINIDDTWQGQRPGPTRALMPNERFPDMMWLCREIHNMGLKVGIYSTPWVTSYASYPGGSAQTPDGSWQKPAPESNSINPNPNQVFGQHSFAKEDARVWAQWGMDYLKYDWHPNDVPHVQEMSEALVESGRDIIYSLSNSAPFDHAADWARLANAWRTTGDIRDHWFSIALIGFSQSRWAPHGGPGHWNDPDMLVLGWVGWGPSLHFTALNADEQFTHISLWALLSAPLLIGCDLERLDPFTLSLLTNDEVLAVNQDELGTPATCVGVEGEAITIDAPPGFPTWLPGSVHYDHNLQVWAKKLADGAWAVGLFNLSDSPRKITAKFADMQLKGPQVVRDLWRQKDIGRFTESYSTEVAPHGAVLVKVSPA